MAIFKSLRTLISQSVIRNNSPPSRAFLNLSLASTSLIPSPFLQSTHRSNFAGHFLFRSSRFFPPLGGPLFLSNPPWKLSQSATPLLLQSDNVLNFLKLRALNLIHRPTHEYNARKFRNERRDVELTNGAAEISVSAGEGVISDSYLSAPNFISFARMVSGPVIGWMIVHDMYSSAFVALAVSGASDWLDGYVARRMKINSVVGSYLDPLADKVLIGFVALAMVDTGLLHPGLVGLVLARDIALVGGAVYKRASDLNWRWNSWRDFFNLDEARAQKIEPLLISKANTVFQLALVAAALLQPGFGNEESELYINYLSWLVASTTVASTAAYGAQHLKSKAVSMKLPRFRN